MPVWIPLRNFKNGEGGYFLIGGISMIKEEDIEVRGKCPHCFEDFESNRIKVPTAFFGADNVVESQRWVTKKYICEDCNSEIVVHIDNGFGGMNIEINNNIREDISFRHYPTHFKNEIG